MSKQKTQDNLNTIEFLVNHGADINTKDNRGLSPLYYACVDYKGKYVTSFDRLKLLIKLGAEVTPSL